MSYQPKYKINRYANKINVNKYAGPSLPSHVVNTLNENDKRVDKNRIRLKDRSDNATIENVLDMKIIKKLHKLFEKGVLAEINGCISTGKEANVYYAKSKNNDEIAIKIYRTSIMQFKKREKYIRGEYRFDHVHSLRNPRKMVQVWVEKEFYNLKRLQQGGVRAPQPILCSDYLLLMEFLGSDGWAAPKLKDVVLPESKFSVLYRECIEIMWRMYNQCRLVHADLSEYNMLYHKGSIVIIDVSQAVDRDHCHATEFLRKDCSNITTYFEKHNVDVMPLQALFDFITDPTVNESNMDEYLDTKMQEVNQENDPEQQIKEAVFKQAYIPQTLTQVVNVERDIKLAKSGQKDLIYKTMLGLKSDLSSPAKVPEILENKHNKDRTSSFNSDSENSEDDSEDDSEDNSETGSEEFEKSKFVNSARPRDESPDSRKIRKKAVKEQQAEKRKTKIKKHVKKRNVKVTKNRK
nr:PREDICTED: serine/threonine-protein kinase rio1 [Linepithema humile]